MIDSRRLYLRLAKGEDNDHFQPLSLLLESNCFHLVELLRTLFHVTKARDVIVVHLSSNPGPSLYKVSMMLLSTANFTDHLSTAQAMTIP